MHTHTLLVWEAIPESVTFYLIPNEHLTDVDREILKVAHGGIINTMTVSREQEEALEKINIALCSDLEYVPDKEKNSPWALRFFKFKHEGALEGVIVTHVYHAGFLL